MTACGIALVGSASEDADDDALKDYLVVGVHYVDVWCRPSPGTLTVYFDSDPVFKSALELAPWPAVKDELRIWKSKAGEVSRCFDLFDSQVAKPQLDFLQDSCPTVALLDELENRGWGRGLSLAAVPTWRHAYK